MENLLDGRKVQLQLVGIDGNIFAVMGAFTNAARRQGFSKQEYTKVTDRVMLAGSYDEALAVIIEHTEQPE